MKNNLPFFTHDNDAGTHWKHKALRVRFGWEGYGRFWRLNEIISKAENCKLRVGNPQIRADCAAELSLSVDDFNQFLMFLADPEQCDLVHYQDGLLWTDRTQEDFARVTRARLLDRERARKKIRAENGQFRPEKHKIRSEPTTEQSRIEIDDDDGDSHFPTQPEKGKIRPEKNGVSPTIAELCFALSQAAPTGLTVSDQLLTDLADRMASLSLDLGYVRWFGDYVRRQPKLENPAGYFRSHFGELVDQYRVYCRGAEEVQAESDEPVEPDDPGAVQELLDGLPWRPERKPRGDPAPPAEGGGEKEPPPFE